MMENVKRERLPYDSKVDRINMLPIQVLELIFSFLTLKEAAANALVCTGWKNLWTSSPNLDFDGSDSVYGKVNSNCSFSVLNEARSSFVRWVDGLVASHRNPNLEEFRVFCDLGSAHTQSIDRWVAYALTNKVQCLDLSLYNMSIYVPRTYDLAGYGYSARGYRINYSFPYKNLHGNFKLLKQLTLNSVEVTSEGLEYFVANCPLLEGLSVSYCHKLSSLEIIRPSPSFKCLEICLCRDLQTVVVRDSNLVTIKYWGGPACTTTFVLRDVPLLTHLWVVYGGELKSLRNVVKMFASVLQQIQFLHFYFRDVMYYSQLSFVMRNLKQLVVSLSNCYKEKDSLRPFLNLISASPLLERFAIEMPSICGWADADATAVGGQRRKMNFLHLEEVQFLHLEEVEFVGYRGTIAQLKLIKHLVGRAPVLHTIILDPSSFDVGMYRPWRRIRLHEFDKDEMLVRAHAEEQLKHIVPHKISLKIL